ncbi:MAG: rhomboid family intramembrane serine protease [Acidobacteria bacterium]|nr:MAG: rhomboid family intramembrane serine protease [Acidobacteriota bacterium]
MPWITFGLMAACAAAFAVTELVPPVSEADVARAFGEAIRFYQQHPYLELPEEFATIVFEDVRERDREPLREVLKELGRQARERGTDIAAEQRRLEELCGKALELRRNHPLRRYGLRPARRSATAFVTHMFLHVGWLHLLGNMLILYFVGPFVEDRLGRPLFTALYLGAGLVAAAAHVATHPGSDVPLVGASGAIAGVMGAFMVRFTRMRVRFFYLFGLWARGTFWAPAWTMLGLWLGQQLFMASLTGAGSTDGVAYWAHVGGFAAGAAAAFAIKRFGIEERYVEPGIRRRIERTVHANPELELALAAEEAGRLDEAWDRLRRLAIRRPDDRDAALALWRLACARDRVPEAVPAMLRAIDRASREGETDVVREQWMELVRYIPEPPADPGLLLRVARALAEGGEGAAARAAIESALQAAEKGLTAPMAVKAARLSATLDPALAERAARLALRLPGLQPGDVDEVRRLLERLARERGVAPAR